MPIFLHIFATFFYVRRSQANQFPSLSSSLFPFPSNVDWLSGLFARFPFFFFFFVPNSRYLFARRHVSRRRKRKRPQKAQSDRQPEKTDTGKEKKRKRGGMKKEKHGITGRQKKHFFESKPNSFSCKKETGKILKSVHLCKKMKWTCIALGYFLPKFTLLFAYLRFPHHFRFPPPLTFFSRPIAMI